MVKSSLSFRTFFFRNTDRIIFSNDIMKRLIKKMHHLDETKLKVINRGINLKDSEINKSKMEIRREFNIPENLFVLLSVGRHTPRKDFALVIKAVSEIKKKRPSLNLKYFLIGRGGETPKLKKLAAELNIENEVVFIGNCENEIRNKFYKLSDVFLMPAITKKDDIEGFGIVFLESNYYKVPLIGTATGGIEAAIIDQETGFLIRQNDLKELVEKILFLYDNEDKRKEMGEKGHKIVVKEQNREKIVYDYINVFTNLILD